jgi:hypothetical protein
MLRQLREHLEQRFQPRGRNAEPIVADAQARLACRRLAPSLPTMAISADAPSFIT